MRNFPSALFDDPNCLHTWLRDRVTWLERAQSDPACAKQSQEYAKLYLQRRANTSDTFARFADLILKAPGGQFDTRETSEAAKEHLDIFVNTIAEELRLLVLWTDALESNIRRQKTSNATRA